MRAAESAVIELKNDNIMAREAKVCSSSSYYVVRYICIDCFNRATALTLFTFSIT